MESLKPIILVQDDAKGIQFALDTLEAHKIIMERGRFFLRKGPCLRWHNKSLNPGQHGS
jgi:hypothetical protein